MQHRKAFTLVELLVVIGIIALLVGILLPALTKARDQANTIKCASNLRGIGQAFAQYLTENKDTFPPSNFFTGLQVNTATQTQTPTTPIYGYTHWSAMISGTGLWENAASYLSNPNSPPVLTAQQLAPFLTTKGWEQFQCPALLNGGLPPDNTYPSNHDLGLQNDAGPNFVDIQAPRLAYTVNEALCPRSYLVAHIPGIMNVWAYKFIKSGQVRHSADTVLGTELWGYQGFAETTSLLNGDNVSNSRRPVSGFISFGTSPDKLYDSLTGIFTPVSEYPTYLNPNPQLEFQQDDAAGGILNPNTTLDFVGRNHGSPAYGSVNVPGVSGGWDLRMSNFLYVDGHVETKKVIDTVYPKNQWGDEMYTLQQQ